MATADSSCNLCGGTVSDHLFDEAPKAGFRLSLVRCARCGLIFTKPLPDKAFLQELYGTASYRDCTVSAQYCLDENVGQAQFAKILPRLAIHAPGKRLLDVGCGAGWFVSACLETGWDAFGIDPSPYISKMARSRIGERIRACYLNDTGWSPESFDALTMWYVMEHVPDPAAFLAQAAVLLKPGGVLLVAVPNARYILFRRRLVHFATGKPGIVHAHEHLYQYTPATMRRLLGKAQFTVIEEDIAPPFFVSGRTINGLKKLAWWGSRALFAGTGVNLGGILIMARKPATK